MDLSSAELEFLNSLDPEERDAVIQELTGERPRKKLKKEKPEKKESKNKSKKGKHKKKSKKEKKKEGDITQNVEVTVDGEKQPQENEDNTIPSFLGSFGGAQGPQTIDVSTQEPSFAAPFVPVLQSGIQSLAPVGDSFSAQLGQTLAYAASSSLPYLLANQSSANAEKRQTQEERLERQKAPKFKTAAQQEAWSNNVARNVGGVLNVMTQAAKEAAAVADQRNMARMIENKENAIPRTFQEKRKSIYKFQQPPGPLEDIVAPLRQEKQFQQKVKDEDFKKGLQQPRLRRIGYEGLRGTKRKLPEIENTGIFRTQLKRGREPSVSGISDMPPLGRISMSLSNNSSERPSISSQRASLSAKRSSASSQKSIPLQQSVPGTDSANWLKKYDENMAKRRALLNAPMLKSPSTFEQEFAEIEEVQQFAASNEPITPQIKKRIMNNYGIDVSALRRSFRKGRNFTTTPLSSSKISSVTPAKSVGKPPQRIQQLLSQIQSSSSSKPIPPSTPSGRLTPPKNATPNTLRYHQNLLDSIAKNPRSQMTTQEYNERSKAIAQQYNKFNTSRETLTSQPSLLQKFRGGLNVVKGKFNVVKGKIYKTRSNVQAGLRSPIGSTPRIGKYGRIY